MSQPQIVSEFLRCLAAEGLNQAQFAERCGASGAKVSRFISGAKPEDQFLRQLCSEWKDPELGRRMAIAHLLDELERTGQPKAKFVVAAQEAPAHPGLEEDFSTIRRRVVDEKDPLLSLVSSVAAVAIQRAVHQRRTKRQEG